MNSPPTRINYYDTVSNADIVTQFHSVIKTALNWTDKVDIPKMEIILDNNTGFFSASIKEKLVKPYLNTEMIEDEPSVRQIANRFIIGFATEFRARGSEPYLDYSGLFTEELEIYQVKKILDSQSKKLRCWQVIFQQFLSPDNSGKKAPVIGASFDISFRNENKIIALNSNIRPIKKVNSDIRYNLDFFSTELLKNVPVVFKAYYGFEYILPFYVVKVNSEQAKKILPSDLIGINSAYFPACAKSNIPLAQKVKKIISEKLTIFPNTPPKEIPIGPISDDPDEQYIPPEKRQLLTRFLMEAMIQSTFDRNGNAVTTLYFGFEWLCSSETRENDVTLPLPSSPSYDSSYDLKINIDGSGNILDGEYIYSETSGLASEISRKKHEGQFDYYKSGIAIYNSGKFSLQKNKYNIDINGTAFLKLINGASEFNRQNDIDVPRAIGEELHGMANDSIDSIGLAKGALDLLGFLPGGKVYSFIFDIILSIVNNILLPSPAKFAKSKLNLFRKKIIYITGENRYEEESYFTNIGELE